MVAGKVENDQREHGQSKDASDAKVAVPDKGRERLGGQSDSQGPRDGIISSRRDGPLLLGKPGLESASPCVCSPLSETTSLCAVRESSNRKNETCWAELSRQRPPIAACVRTTAPSCLSVHSSHPASPTLPYRISLPRARWYRQASWPSQSRILPW
jgi:hypothetical protein